MYCQCDKFARFIITHKGKTGYVCSNGKCSFYALAPEQCVGYKRMVPNLSNTVNSQLVITIIHFEALLHPETRSDAIMVHVEGKENKQVQAILHDAQYNGTWYTTREAYLFDMSYYKLLVKALTGLKYVAVEEIPNFFFRCLEKARAIVNENKTTSSNKTFCSTSSNNNSNDYIDDINNNNNKSNMADKNNINMMTDSDDYVMQQLRPFQRQGVEFVISHGGRAMIADDMGLGKTIQAIAIAHHYRSEWPTLIVCPMSLMENWLNEFNKFCGISFSRMTIIQGTKPANPSTINEHDIIVVSYSSLKSVEAFTFKVIVLDESHFIKDSEAKRTRLAVQLCHRAIRVVLLTGTPAMSRPIELYAQLITLQPAILPSRYLFAARYCNSYRSNFGVDMTGHSHTDELHFLLENFIIRRTKKELGNELPSKTRQLLYIHVTERERKQMETQVSALRKSITARSATTFRNHNVTNDDVSNSNNNEAASWSRLPNAFELKSATAHAKIPAVQDYVSRVVETHVENNEKVIFFAHHTCMMEAIRGAILTLRPKHPIDYIYITGETSSLQREEQINHFRNEATCYVAILSMQSSGTGHNLTCASTVIFAELDWNPSTHLQCEDRVHRMGQSTPCTIKYLLAEGTADAVIWPLLQSKLTVTRALLANDARQLVEQPELLRNADTHKVQRGDFTTTTTNNETLFLEGELSQQSTLDGFVKLHKIPIATEPNKIIDATIHKTMNEAEHEMKYVNRNINNSDNDKTEKEVIDITENNTALENDHTDLGITNETSTIDLDENIEHKSSHNKEQVRNPCCTPRANKQTECFTNGTEQTCHEANTPVSSHRTSCVNNSNNNSNSVSASPSKNTPTAPRIVISLAEMEERKAARRTTAAALFKHTSPTLPLHSSYQANMHQATNNNGYFSNSTHESTTNSTSRYKQKHEQQEPMSVIAMMRKHAGKVENSDNNSSDTKDRSSSSNSSNNNKTENVEFTTVATTNATKRPKYESAACLVNGSNNDNNAKCNLPMESSNTITPLDPSNKNVDLQAHVNLIHSTPVVIAASPHITPIRRRTTFTMSSVHNSEVIHSPLQHEQQKQQQRQLSEETLQIPSYTSVASSISIPFHFHKNSKANIHEADSTALQTVNDANDSDCSGSKTTSNDSNTYLSNIDNVCNNTEIKMSSTNNHTSPQKVYTGKRTIIKLHTTNDVSNNTTNTTDSKNQTCCQNNVSEANQEFHHEIKERTSSVTNALSAELNTQSTSSATDLKDNTTRTSARTLFKFHINDGSLRQ